MTMSDESKDKLLDHEADGIREFDNNLPKWWLYGFYITIVLACIYMYYYHVHTGSDWNVLWYGARGSAQEYSAEMDAAAAKLASAPKGPEVKMVLLSDKESLEEGKEIFNGDANLCYTCHRADLGGEVGPNLTDEFWLHGCSLEDVIKSIRTGYPEKGMMEYGSGAKLDDKKLLQVASYIISMRGTNPSNPKPIEEGRDVQCQ
jgi:cytochrome c oxidase cbb3-type subunit 3